MRGTLVAGAAPWLELSLVPMVTNLPGGESPALLVELS